jgi:hypothetical protein
MEISRDAECVDNARDAKRKAESSTALMSKKHAKGPVREDPEVFTKSSVLLQRIWRRKFKCNTTYQIVEKFFATGPTIEHVKSIRYSLE